MTPLFNTLTSCFFNPSNNNEKVYLDALKYVRKDGQLVSDRTGVGTYSCFGPQMVFDLRQGFPLLTTKRVPFKAILHELLWFLKGDTNIQYLHDNNVTIWDEWADENGNLGPIYGAMWRKFPNPDGTFTDQIQEVFNTLLNDPDTRRAVVSGWHPGLLPRSGSFAENIAAGRQALPPCHTLWQLKSVPIPDVDKILMLKDHSIRTKVTGRPSPVRLSKDGVLRCYKHSGLGLPTRYLDLKLYQRSGDIFLGIPFNIASYSLLLHMFAASLNMIPRFFVHTCGDLHLYTNHVNQADLQLQRKPTSPPMLSIPGTEGVLLPSGYTYIRDSSTVVGPTVLPLVVNYDPHDTIPAPVAV